MSALHRNIMNWRQGGDSTGQRYGPTGTGIRNQTPDSCAPAYTRWSRFYGSPIKLSRRAKKIPCSVPEYFLLRAACAHTLVQTATSSSGVQPALRRPADFLRVASEPTPGWCRRFTEIIFDRRLSCTVSNLSAQTEDHRGTHENKTFHNPDLGGGRVWWREQPTTDLWYLSVSAEASV